MVADSKERTRAGHLLHGADPLLHDGERAGRRFGAASGRMGSALGAETTVGVDEEIAGRHGERRVRQSVAHPLRWTGGVSIRRFGGSP
ncbi:hypothetical protein [Pendulispora albinea]|uniref:Uncharacterized protein n=1 Tax=Pendulispora albinea TaxID=2741071 RepID=A0ABZ2LL67_9BACT